MLNIPSDLFSGSSDSKQKLQNLIKKIPNNELNTKNKICSDDLPTRNSHKPEQVSSYKSSNIVDSDQITVLQKELMINEEVV